MLNRSTLLEEYLEKYPDPARISDLSDARTEQSNPKTRTLSQLAQKNPAQAISVILEVERDALQAFLEHTAEYKTIENFVKQAALHHQRLFLVGCGASGRLVMLIERLTRDLQTHQNKLQVIAIAAGGDIALVNSISQCEDSVELAVTQLQLQGYQAGDAIIGFSANGAATFVLAALDYALHQKSSALLITCNVKELIIQRVQALQKTHIFQQGIPKNLDIISFILPPPALAGSTRMHPTTIMLLACLPILAEMDTRYQDPASLVHDLLKAIQQLPLEKLSALCRLEQDAYARGQAILYRVQDAEGPHKGLTSFTLFTDLTERNPTFNLPPLRRLTDLDTHTPSLFWLSVEQTHTAEEFWMHLLHRKPFSLAISELPETAESYWRDCDFSIEAARIRQEKIGPHTAIHFAWKGAQFHISGKQFSIMIDMAKLPPFTQQLLLKIILNACSTTIFAATRCHGNWMTNLAPTNLKLIQRMERIMQLLALEEETPPPLLSIRQKLIHAVMDQKA